METADMVTLVLPKITATIDELTLCRLSRKEQKRVRKFQRSMSKIGPLLISKNKVIHIESALCEIRRIIRHAEVWIEEKITSTIKHHLSALLSYMDELEILVQLELENHGIIPQILAGIKSLVSIFI